MLKQTKAYYFFHQSDTFVPLSSEYKSPPMSNTIETSVSPEQAAELVRQIGLLAETFEKKRNAADRFS